jgi:transposase
MSILEMHKEGLSVSEIAARSGRDRKTVRKYIARGVALPVYKPRARKARRVDAFVDYLRQRIARFPGLSERRLLREIRELGYAGGRTQVGDVLRALRPPKQKEFPPRFETPAGKQAQVDFAHFSVNFTERSEERRSVWLFSLVLGHSRYLWARFVEHQDLQTLLRCHMQAFEQLGGVPAEILYDRMKAVVIREDAEQHIVYNEKLIALAKHYAFSPRACKAYRAQTKGKVERPFRYIRQDFFLGRSFANMQELNAQLQQWLVDLANARRHATTGRIVAEHFAGEKLALKALPQVGFNDLLRLQRRVSHEGLVSLGGNYYSVPNGTRARLIEVHQLVREVHLYAEGQCIARHPVLEGRREVSLLPGHRARAPKAHPPAPALAPSVARRDLRCYELIGARLARGGQP